MAHPSMLQPDLPEPDSARQEDSAADHSAKPDADAGRLLARLASKLAEHGGGAGSADLALDLVLNEIVEQARLATTATGAAIALLRGGEMVCRATSGINAPDLGIRLNTRSGLSGACVRTSQVQRCDDTETDPRVDAKASRGLNVRSILVVPILSAQDLVGVFEIFSPRPRAFGDREVQTLHALSLRIVENLERAAETAAQTRVPSPAAPLRITDTPPPAVTEAEEVEEDRPIEGVEQMLEPEEKPRDFWTTFLTAIVIGLALLLGWMVGRTGWNATAVQSRVTKPAVPVAATPQTGSAPDVIEPPSAQLPAKKPLSQAAGKTRIESTESPRGGLVVYEKGKVIFQIAPAAKPSGAPPVKVASDVAATYVTQRVEPEYPEAARQDRLQGKVVLNVVVGKEGTVRKVTLENGDPRLAEAAANAVRKWRFQPYAEDGQAVEFETSITVEFKLPESSN